MTVHVMRTRMPRLTILIAAVLLFAAISFLVPRKSYALSTNGNGGTTDVGTWFITYNSTANWANNFGHGFPIMYRPLDQNGNYSIPDSTSTAQADFYLQQLADAKIDFLLFDETNGGMAGYAMENTYVVDNAGIMCQRIKAWNDTHSWKIKYAFAIGVYDALRGSDSVGLTAENQAHYVFDNFYNNSAYGGPSNYYQVDGKPLLILYNWASDTLAQWNAYTGSKTYGSQFTVRRASNSEAGTYGWQTAYGTQVNSEVEVVSPGWNNHVGSTPIPRNNGDYYTASWNTVLSNPLPRIVMITAFNDYNEDSAIWTADTTNLNTTYDEKWSGHDGLLHPTMYWDMTKSYIATMRAMPAGPTNLALGGATTVNSVYAPWPKSNLTDGNRGTAYSSQVGAKSDHTEWIELDLGSVKAFNAVTLVNRSDMAYGFPKDFKIQVWNGSTWIDRVAQTNYAQPAAGAAVPFTWSYTDTTNKIRIYASSLRPDNMGDYVLQFAEVEVYNATVANAGFESPATTSPSYITYGPMTSGWTFDSGAGVQHNGSWFGASNAPEGTQTAFVQNNGQFSQSIALTAGTHTVSFLAAKRTAFGGTQSFDVYCDTTLVGSFTPSSGSFASFTTSSFATTAGNHTIKFVGATTSGDNTDFIDAVVVN